jgi:arylsulfatase A-like enzyme
VSTTSFTGSRSAILTGRNSFELEDDILLAGCLPKKILTYTSILEKAGYKVGATGKGWEKCIAFGGNRRIGNSSDPL